MAEHTLFSGTGAIDVTFDAHNYEQVVFKMVSSDALASVAVSVNSGGAWAPAIEFTTSAPIVLTGTSAQVQLVGDMYRLVYANGAGYTITLSASPRRYVVEG